jgi:hypothetical protein
MVGTGTPTVIWGFYWGIKKVMSNLDIVQILDVKTFIKPPNHGE